MSTLVQVPKSNFVVSCCTDEDRREVHYSAKPPSDFLRAKYRIRHD